MTNKHHAQHHYKIGDIGDGFSGKIIQGDIYQPTPLRETLDALEYNEKMYQYQQDWAQWQLRKYQKIGTLLMVMVLAVIAYSEYYLPIQRAGGIAELVMQKRQMGDNGLYPTVLMFAVPLVIFGFIQCCYFGYIKPMSQKLFPLV